MHLFVCLWCSCLPAMCPSFCWWCICLSVMRLSVCPGDLLQPAPTHPHATWVAMYPALFHLLLPGNTSAWWHICLSSQIMNLTLLIAIFIICYFWSWLWNNKNTCLNEKFKSIPVEHFFLFLACGVTLFSQSGRRKKWFWKKKFNAGKAKTIWSSPLQWVFWGFSYVCWGIGYLTSTGAESSIWYTRDLS